MEAFSLRIKRALNAFYQFPKYPAYSLRPDTYVSSNIYFLIGCLMHPVEALKRFLYKGQFKKPKNQIDHNLGFLVINDFKSPKLSELIDHSLKFYDSKRMVTDTKQIKSFLNQWWINPELEMHSPIWNFATDEEILSIVTDYLGYVPLLGAAVLWYSPNSHFEEGRSQMFHMDGEDRKQVKVFIHLTDIDEYSGPLTLIPAQESRAIFNTLIHEKKLNRRNTKISDETVFEIVRPTAQQVVTGKTGTLAFVDTDSCYHYGSRPSPKSRLILQLQYISPFSVHQPMFGRHINELVKERNKNSNTQEIQNLVLGYQHLAFPKIQN